MFSFFLERKKIFSLGVACAVALALFSACGDTGSDVYYANIVYSDFSGTWRSSSSDSYSIASSKMSYDDGGEYGDYDSDFKDATITGCYQFIVFNAESSNNGAINTAVNDKSGVFILQFASNKYGAIYYRNKMQNSVEMATAYNPDYTQALFDTLEEAKGAFVSISAVSSYVSIWGTYSISNE